MTKKIIPPWMLSTALCLCFSCGGDNKSEVSETAETVYKYLIEGKYEDFVRSIAYSDGMTDAYRDQLIGLATQYAAREKERRGGITSVRALRDTVSGDVADVFLKVSFGDSTSEEISVPMVRVGKKWKMQ